VRARAVRLRRPMPPKSSHPVSPAGGGYRRIKTARKVYIVQCDRGLAGSCSVAEDRHHRPAFRSHLELLAGRQGQLPRRQGSRRQIPRGLPADRRQSARRAVLHGPRGPLPNGSGGDPPVSRCGYRTANRRQHPRDRPAGRARVPHRLRRQRPPRAGARAGAADQFGRGQVRLHRRRHARPGGHSHRRRPDIGLHAARGAAAHGGHGAHQRLRRGAPHRRRPARRPARGQLPGPRGQHQFRAGAPGGGNAVRADRSGALPAAHPRADRGFLHRAHAGRPRPGARAGVAPRSQSFPAGPDRYPRRSRPQGRGRRGRGRDG